MKISISLADDLLQRTDDFADQNGMTRSGLISVALRQYMNTIEFIRKLCLQYHVSADYILELPKGLPWGR